MIYHFSMIIVFDNDGNIVFESEEEKMILFQTIGKAVVDFVSSDLEEVELFVLEDEVGNKISVNSSIKEWVNPSILNKNQEN